MRFSHDSPTADFSFYVRPRHLLAETLIIYVIIRS
jgi:hypothetical protein